MPTVGPQFQPVLPGMGRIKRAAPKAVPAVTPHPTNSGPQPGQLVMGVGDLAKGRSVDLGFHRVPITSGPMAGGARVVSKGSEEHHYEVDPHGYVQEGFGQTPHHDLEGGGVSGGHPSAADLYGTHGGRYAETLAASAHKEGGSLSGYGITANTERLHDDQVKAVNKHWDSQPLVQFPTSQLIHSTQQHTETEGDATEQRTTQRPARGWRAATGSPSGLGQRYATLHTAGGSPQMAAAHTDVPGSGEGRQRVEAIKADIAKGGKIKKPIWMTKVNGRYFQLDGHHRMVAAREMGLSHVPVRLWDQDAERG